MLDRELSIAHRVSQYNLLGDADLLSGADLAAEHLYSTAHYDDPAELDWDERTGRESFTSAALIFDAPAALTFDDELPRPAGRQLGEFASVRVGVMQRGNSMYADSVESTESLGH